MSGGKPSVKIIKMRDKGIELPTFSKLPNNNSVIHKFVVDFMAKKAVQYADLSKRSIVVFDTDTKDASLLNSFLEKVDAEEAEVVGFVTDPKSMGNIRDDLITTNNLELLPESFLSCYHKFSGEADVVLCLPPFIHGKYLDKGDMDKIFSEQNLPTQYDSFQAYLLASLSVLADNGVGVFMLPNTIYSTKAMKEVRRHLNFNYDVLEVFDFGDLNIAETDINPSIFIIKNSKGPNVALGTSVYLAEEGDPGDEAEDEDLSDLVSVIDKPVEIKQGEINLRDAFWVIRDSEDEKFKSEIEEKATNRFADLFWVHSGIHTMAHDVFIKDSWSFESKFLRPVQTNLISLNFAVPPEYDKRILYPYHEDGSLASLKECWNMRDYFMDHRERLSSRHPVNQGKVKWYEPAYAGEKMPWHLPKIVWKDTQEYPAFWVDDKRSIVNQDMHWMVLKDDEPEDMFWFALGVLNSSVIFQYYNVAFNHRQKGSERRYSRHYILGFPFPDFYQPVSREIVNLVKTAFVINSAGLADFEFGEQLDELVEEAFGL